MSSTGAFDVAGQHERMKSQVRSFGPDAKDVPDGKYRVDGSDYIYTFKGGELVLAERASPETDPADIIPVPTDTNPAAR
jgi:hypothetical protein